MLRVFMLISLIIIACIVGYLAFHYLSPGVGRTKDHQDDTSSNATQTLLPKEEESKKQCDPRKIPWYFRPKTPA